MKSLIRFLRYAIAARKLRNDQSKFLLAFRECGSVLHAARATKLDRWTHYQWLKTDSSYAKRFECVREIVAQEIDELARRVVPTTRENELFRILVKTRQREMQSKVR